MRTFVIWSVHFRTCRSGPYPRSVIVDSGTSCGAASFRSSFLGQFSTMAYTTVLAVLLLPLFVYLSMESFVYVFECSCWRTLIRQVWLFWVLTAVWYIVFNIHSVPGFGCMPVFMWLVASYADTFCDFLFILVSLHRIRHESFWMLNIHASHLTTCYKWLSAWPVKEILWQTLNWDGRKLFLWNN